jgi:16S rRNA (uracil1498-N3)-methyltransferase
LREAERKEPKRKRKRRGKRTPAMDRIVLDQKGSVGKEVLIKGPPLEALRFQGVRAGSIVTLTDPEGNDFRGRVIHLLEEKASVLVFYAFPSPTESLLKIVLLQALPEKERMELIIQKATELGVSTIVPFKSERSISLGEREAKQKKAHRWQHIAIKAVEQSRRARVPLVETYRSITEALGFCEGAGLKILLWEKEGRNLRGILTQDICNVLRCHPELGSGSHLKGKNEALNDRRAESDLGLEERAGVKSPYRGTIYAMVGPEGGFTEEEVRQAKETGFIPVKLGQRILRTETAAITLMGILQYELGDLG